LHEQQRQEQQREPEGFGISHLEHGRQRGRAQQHDAEQSGCGIHSGTAQHALEQQGRTHAGDDRDDHGDDRERQPQSREHPEDHRVDGQERPRVLGDVARNVHG
jgi:hypothetical protein